jgi:hypothetical protein
MQESEQLLERRGWNSICQNCNGENASIQVMDYAKLTRQ